jgi:hypothetical protein
MVGSSQLGWSLDSFESGMSKPHRKVGLIHSNKIEDIMNRTVEALIKDAWSKDIDPVDVTHVLNEEGIELTLEQVNHLYREWYKEVNVH